METNYSTQDAQVGQVGAFRFWCQKVLPAVYDDSLSYYELLCKMVAKLNEVITVNNTSGEAIQKIIDSITALQKEFEIFKESGFEDYYEEQLDKWINDHMPEIIGKYIKMVFFGLTKRGYFVAYIPDGWNDIIFDTGMVYGLDTYGRLILRMDVDSPNDVFDQVPEVTYPHQLRQLEYYVANIMETLYSAEGEG